MWRKSKLTKPTVQLLVQDSFKVQTVVKVPSLNNVPKQSKHLVSCHVATHVRSAISKGLPQKKGIRPDVKETKIKHVKGVSFVNHCLFARSVPNVPKCCQRAGCRRQTPNLLAQMARARCKPQGGLHLEGGLCPTIQNETTSDTVSSHQKWLCKSGKKPGSITGLNCLKEKLVVEKVVVRTSLSFYNRLFLVPKPNNQSISCPGA